MERLDKFLCDSGAGTRSQVKVILKTGRVSVDGKPEKDGGRKVDPQKNEVCLDGQRLGGRYRAVFMLNKPQGYVTAIQDPREKTVMDLLPPDVKHLELKPVGRLDKATEGLLLFTNDGELMQRMIHPKYEVDKLYRVTVRGDWKKGTELLRQMRLLEGEPIAPAQVEVLSGQGENAVLQVTIHQGKNRQIRRMCRQAGLTVLRLERVAEHGILLGNLPCGKWRYLTEEEVKTLKGSDEP